MNKRIIIGVSVILVTTLAIVGYKKGWFGNKKPTIKSTTKRATQQTTSKQTTSKIADSIFKKLPNILTQEEADAIMNRVNIYTKNYVQEYGGMTSFSRNETKNMLQPLYDNGYKVENDKAVKI